MKGGKNGEVVVVCKKEKDRVVSLSAPKCITCIVCINVPE